MFFEPVEVSLIQENKIVSSDQNILKTKITNLEKKVDLLILILFVLQPLPIKKQAEKLKWILFLI